MFRFSIRDLLWLMVVVALGLGWWLEYRQFAPQEKATIRQTRKMLKDIRESMGK